MPNLGFTALKAIKTAFAEEYLSLIGQGGFAVLGRSWGVSYGTAWRMVKVEDYEPRDNRIIKQLRKEAIARGIIESTTKKRMRVEIEPELDKEDLSLIRRMTVKERTKILVTAAKGEIDE